MRVAVVVGICLALLLLVKVFQPRAPQPPQQSAGSGTKTALDQALHDLETRRAQLDATVWQQEVQAQRYEESIVRLWDKLRHSDQPWNELASVSLESITLGQLILDHKYANNIEFLRAQGARTRTAHEWKEFVAQQKRRFQIVQSEWHHARFDVQPDGPRSTVTVTLHMLDIQAEDRIVLKGELAIDWPVDGTVRPRRIDATNLKVWRRHGPPPFRLAASLPATTQGSTDFLAAYDLDGDGLSEIFFGDRVFYNRGNGDFSAARLSPFRKRPLQSAVLADFNADGRTDLLCADPQANPQLYLADAAGRFANPPTVIDAVQPIASFSTAITAGDVNGDGLLDAWLTQYKPPYQKGQMPKPYYDANDGHPSYLLINDGQGNFRDETQARGLAEKRHRRTYSSSLVDLDTDGDLDLVVVSDFAGLDIHRNDDGVFCDITDQIVDESHNFGMSHAIADFNGDAELDLFVCGMGSTTARRLDAMQAWRSDRHVESQMRSIMGYGNRLYLQQADKLVEPPFGHQLARTGWSWGVAEFDYDNDGDRDIYVGNGHISGASAKDYCTQFWRHDIYTGDSTHNPVLEQYFLNQQTAFQHGSWNGYEFNCLLTNQRGQEFVETAFLLGLAHQFDTRNVVADDIDSNGLVDLLIVEHPRGQPATLHIWKNYGQHRNWIGVVLPEQAGITLPGTRVLLRTADGDQVACVSNGDSFNSQHATTIHFGLGDQEKVESIQILRPHEKMQVLNRPQVGQYHIVERSPL